MLKEFPILVKSKNISFKNASAPIERVLINILIVF